MNSYRIFGRGDGHDYGLWPGETPEEALAAMYQEAGYEGPVDLTPWLVEAEKEEELHLGRWGQHERTLTTNSPCSSYGRPVLRVIEPDRQVVDCGPADFVSLPGPLAPFTPAGQVVEEMVALRLEKGQRLSSRERCLLHSFLGYRVCCSKGR